MTTDKVVGARRAEYLAKGTALGDPLFGWRLCSNHFVELMLSAHRYRSESRGEILKEARRFGQALTFILSSMRYNSTSVENDISEEITQVVNGLNVLAASTAVISGQQLYEIVVGSRSTFQELKNVQNAITRMYTKITNYVVSRRDAVASLEYTITVDKPINVATWTSATKELAEMIPLFTLAEIAEEKGILPPLQLAHMRERITASNELLATIMYDTIEMSPQAAEQLNLAVIRRIGAKVSEEGKVELPPPIADEPNKPPRAAPIPGLLTPSPSPSPQRGTRIVKPPPPSSTPPPQSSSPAPPPYVGQYRSTPRN
jgi:hypothetical protein